MIETKILIAGDDCRFRAAFERFSDERKYIECQFAETQSQAIHLIESVHDSGAPVHACIAQMAWDEGDGPEILAETQAKFPRAALALVAEPHEMDGALKSVKDHVADRVIPANSNNHEFSSHVEQLVGHQERLESLTTALAEYPGKHLFVTGATGFLGQQFIRDLMRCSDTTVTALSRGRKGKRYDERLPFDISPYEDRLRFVEGDVQLPDLGLDDTVREDLNRTVDEVWHLAAITSFDEVLREKTFSVNLAGTAHVVNFARKLPHLKMFHHISTAYVSGNCVWPERVTETLGERPEGFRNPYDESKFEAEHLVADSGLPWTIFRPSIVLGECVSGRCDGQTVYNIAKMVRLAKILGEQDAESQGLPPDHHSFRVVANLDATKNMIPVDMVNHSMLRARATQPAPGSVFHVTHPQPTHIADVVGVLARLLEADHYEIVDSLEGESLSVPEQTLERVANVFRPYMVAGDPIFDRTGLDELLEDANVPAIGVPFLRESFDAFYSQYFGAEYRQQAVPT